MLSAHSECYGIDTEGLLLSAEYTGHIVINWQKRQKIDAAYRHGGIACNRLT